MDRPDDPDATVPPISADATATLPPSPRGPAGTDEAVVPGYEILATLGRGGMGVVYQARHLALNRVVALKMILSGGHASEADISRFRTEAGAVARLQHPGIVQIFEVGEVNGLPFFCLELVPGGSLERKLNGQPLPPSQAAALVEQIARAVEAAHRGQIVHRDLKPANVLLTDAGEPKLTDFGLAKRLDEASGQTRTGSIMGTPSYMAPEQAEGKKDVGPPADVYAIGAILYECLTGRPPFRAASAFDTVLQVLSEEPVEPRRLNPALPRDLQTIALKCLEKSPARRYASAEALAEDLRRYRAGETISARPAGRLERAAKWARRRPLAAALGGVIAVSLLTLAGAGAWFTRSVQHERDRALEQEEKALTARALAEAQRERAEATLAASLLQQGRLDEIDGALRGWEWHQAFRARRGSSLVLEGHPYGPAAIRADGAGKRLLTPSSRAVFVHDARSGELLRTFGRHDNYGTIFVEVSADGELAASAATNDAIYLWRPADGTVVWSDTSKGLTPRIALSPDGRWLAYAFDRGAPTIHLLDVAKRAVARSWQAHDRSLLSMTFSADGKRLATTHSARGSGQKGVRVWAVATGAPEAELDTEADRAAFTPNGQWLITDAGTWATADWRPRLKGLPSLKPRDRFALSPDGERIAFASWSGPVQLASVSTGRTLRTWPAISDATALTFSADGQRLWVARTSGALVSLDVRLARDVLRLSQNGGHDLAFSPDGKRVALAVSEPDLGDFVNGALELRDARSGQLVWKVAPPLKRATGYRSVAFSPDGRWLAVGTGFYVAGRDKKHRRTGRQSLKPAEVHLYDPATGKRVRTLGAHPGPVRAVAFSPEGRWVAAACDRQDERGSPLPGEVKLYPVAGGEPVSLGPFGAGALDLAFAPDGRLATACADGTLTLWKPGSREVVWKVRASGASLLSVAVSPDGKQVAAGGLGRWITVRDASTGEELLRLEAKNEETRGLAFHPRGPRLASASAFGSISVWDLATGVEIATLSGDVLSRLRFSTDGDRLAAIGFGVWHCFDGRPAPEARALTGAGFSTFQVGLSPDGAHTAALHPVRAGRPRELVVWRNADGRLLHRLALPPRTELESYFGFAADGRLVADGGKAWALPSGEPAESAPAVIRCTTQTSRSADGRWLVRAEGRVVRLIDTRPSPAEIALRRELTAIDPDWHADQAYYARQRRDAFARAFHVRTGLLVAPKHPRLLALQAELAKP